MNDFEIIIMLAEKDFPLLEKMLPYCKKIYLPKVFVLLRVLG